MPALSVSRLVSAALVAVLAAAQTVQPSNATLDQDESGSLVQLTFTNPPPAPGAAFYNVAPLTPNAGKGELESNGLGVRFLSCHMSRIYPSRTLLTNLQQIHDSGNVRAIDSQTETSVGKNDIAYISCDLSSSPGFIDPSDLVGKVGALTPTAILLYSLDSAECNLNGSYPFTSIYSMTSANDSTSLLTTLQQNNNNLTALIALNTSSSANGTSADGAPGGPPPTTAVAMSILYSITGIITLLFLVVIASGAIRAHRHPERYGPRAGGSTGRPRQSRAKGLARAMLETLPIVKFGDPEPVKSGDRDIEMEDGTSSVHHVPEVTGAAVETEIEQRPKDPATTVNGESGGDPTAATDEAEGSAEASPAGGELGCSICTEDFTTGEDVRVLPCHHKYHPACIDPWLLNVSGTCPLWYVFSPTFFTSHTNSPPAAMISAPSSPQVPRLPKATNSHLPSPPATTQRTTPNQKPTPATTLRIATACACPASWTSPASAPRPQKNVSPPYASSESSHNRRMHLPLPLPAQGTSKADPHA